MTAYCSQCGAQIQTAAGCPRHGNGSSLLRRHQVIPALRDQPIEPAPGHQLYTNGDPHAPDSIKDHNGQVVLGLCKVCGKGEVDLSGPCVAPTQRKATNCSTCNATGNERGGGGAIPCSSCNGHGWIALNFPQPRMYEPAGEKPLIVAEVTTAKVSLTELEQALCAALAWGRAYGQAIPRHQWEEMRDSQIRMHMAKLLDLTLEQVKLQHRCNPTEGRLLGKASVEWSCPECLQPWKWNGTGWYKLTPPTTDPHQNTPQQTQDDSWAKFDPRTETMMGDG